MDNKPLICKNIECRVRIQKGSQRVCQDCYRQNQSYLNIKIQNIECEHLNLFEQSKPEIENFLQLGLQYNSSHELKMARLNTLKNLMQAKQKSIQAIQNQFNILQEYKTCLQRKIAQFGEIHQEEEQQNEIINAKEIHLNESMFKIKKITSLISLKKYSLLAQIPLLYDCLAWCSRLTFGQDEIEVSNVVLSYMDEVTLVQSELNLQKRKQFYVDEEGLIMTPSHLYNYNLAQKNMILFIYRIQQILNIPLPYPIYIDEHDYPQLTVWPIYMKQFKTDSYSFQDSCLTLLQMNIYYIIYQMNGNVETSLKRGNHLNLIELLNTCLNNLQSYNSVDQLAINKRLLDGYQKPHRNFVEERRTLIMIKYAQSSQDKFKQQRDLGLHLIKNNSDDDFELINDLS